MLSVGGTVSSLSYQLALYYLVVSNTVSCFSERGAPSDHSEQQRQMLMDQMMYRAASSNATMSSFNESLQYQAWQQQQEHQQQQLHQHQHQQQQQLNLQIHQQNKQEQQEHLNGRQQQQQQQQQPLQKQQRQQQPQQQKQQKQQQKQQQRMLQEQHLQQHHQLQQQQLHQQQQLLRYAIESEQMARSYSPWTMPFQGLSYPQQLWAHAKSQPNDGFPGYSNSSSYSSNNASSSNCSSHTTSIVSSSNCGDGSENGRKRSNSFLVKPSVIGSAPKQTTLSGATLATGQATSKFAKYRCSLWYSRFLFAGFVLHLDNMHSHCKEAHFFESKVVIVQICHVLNSYFRVENKLFCCLFHETCCCIPA